MKKLLNRLGSPDAISWVNFAVVFVLQMAGSTLSSLVDFSERPLEFYSLRVFVLLCLIPVFILGRFALNRFAKIEPRPIITLATFLAALVITSFLFDYLLVVFEFADAPQGFRRLSTNAVGFLTACILSSLLVTYAREFSRDNQQLVASVKNLIETRSRASEKIAARQAELIETIKEQINSALCRVQGQNQAEDALHMRSLIDDVVRPISYDLARNVKSDSAISQLVVEPKVDWIKVNSHTLRSTPFHFLAAPMALGFIIAPFLISNFQLAGATAALGSGVVFSIVALLGNHLWLTIPASWSEALRGTLFSLANAFIAFATAPIIAFATGFDFLEPSRMVAWVVFCNLIAWTVALVGGALDLLKITNSALGKSVDELKREVIRLNGSYRALQQGISRALHGPVQEAITAALLKLNSSSASQNRESLAEDLRLRIAKSLEVLEVPAQVVTDVNRSLEDLRELWSDAIAITVSLDPKDLKTLHSQPWTSKTVVELVRESVSNAIRHGNATRISIQIQCSLDSGSVNLRVANNGQPLPEGPRYGLGSQLFDEVCLDWNRRQESSGVVFEATVPLVEAVSSAK